MIRFKKIEKNNNCISRNKNIQKMSPNSVCNQKHKRIKHCTEPINYVELGHIQNYLCPQDAIGTIKSCVGLCFENPKLMKNIDMVCTLEEVGTVKEEEIVDKVGQSIKSHELFMNLNEVFDNNGNLLSYSISQSDSSIEDVPQIFFQDWEVMGSKKRKR